MCKCCVNKATGSTKELYPLLYLYPALFILLLQKIVPNEPVQLLVVADKQRCGEDSEKGTNSPNQHHSSQETSSPMPPKFDPSQVVDVFICVTDGEVGMTSSLAPKIGLLYSADLGSMTPEQLEGLYKS
ncbi:hypothetical protein VNO80_02810 [Phaseolus coccineus]|uniref:Uncharacterized protein n=1 Tax=Phaseolus coccineus TaxID=3886 RepID=A0AAN9NQL2_PHACN